MDVEGQKVGIIGSGLIGKSWAMIFASVGYKVVLFDVAKEQVTKALSSIGEELAEFESLGVLRGNKLTAEQQNELISGTDNLEDCVKDTVWVQECVPETLNLKKKVWANIDKLVTDTTIMASSTSCIVPSAISENLTHRGQFIVAHPCNPPYHTPMVELVPAPWTTDKTRETARKIMADVGQGPVSLNREVPGFVLNRMQYSLLNECWRLVRDGVVSPQDLDVVMKDGMGMRYAFMGPMETIHLNADGTQNYVDRYGETIYNVSQDLGDIPTGWRQQTEEDKKDTANLHASMCATVPLEELDSRRVWRDKRLAALAKLKRDMERSEPQ